MAGFRWSSARRTVAAALAATDGAADRAPAEEDGAEKLPSMHRARHIQLTIEPMGEEMPLARASHSSLGFRLRATAAVSLKG
jgi:hypothetical protein